MYMYYKQTHKNYSFFIKKDENYKEFTITKPGRFVLWKKCCYNLITSITTFLSTLVRRRSAICSHLLLRYKAKKQSFTILQPCTMYVQRYVLNAVRNIKENEIFQTSLHSIWMRLSIRTSVRIICEKYLFYIWKKLGVYIRSDTVKPK